MIGLNFGVLAQVRDFPVSTMVLLNLRGEIWFKQGNSTGRARLASSGSFDQDKPFVVDSSAGEYEFGTGNTRVIKFLVDLSTANVVQANFPTIADPASGATGVIELTDSKVGKSLWIVKDGSGYYISGTPQRLRIFLVIDRVLV